MRRVVAASLVAALTFGAGCAFFRSPETPMPAVAHVSDAAPSGRGLVVFVPGFGDGPEDFEEHGFVALVRALKPDYDVIATDAHFGYYKGFTVVERLRADVIAPARARGYARIWLVGISMGGLGVLSYAMDHGDDLAGVIALAPYLGDSDIAEAVTEAGGLRAWQPPADIDAIEDSEERHYYRLWSWFKTLGAPPSGNSPEVHLAWGDDDRVGGPAALVADVLPPAHTRTAPGGHKWVVWRPLFEALARDVLAVAPEAD